MKYNTQYICKYSDPDVFLENEKNTLSKNEIDFVRNILYKTDILNIFNMADFNEEEINNYIHNIYDKIKINNDFVVIMKKFAKFFFCDDCELGLLIMFSYDYLEYTHPCICEFLESNVISSDKLSKLENIKI
jgi:hypothetical protein